MIIFSPHTKFTMQRISDHVANGAYLYAKIEWKEYEDWINGEKKTIFNNVSGLIEKLTDRYHLELSPRQRNYRLEKGFPICTAIVQLDLFDKYKWTVHLLFTTPRTRDFNLQCGVAPKKIVKAKEREKIEELQQKFNGFSWIKPEIQTEIDLIYSYFKDREPLQFVLNDPVSLQVNQHMNFELVRTDYKVYKPTEKEYKDRIKSFSWSWRYSKQSFLRMKSRLISIVNNLVSQKNNTQAEKNRADLRNFFTTIETWAVFKSNRQQSGELLHFAQRFIHKRARKSWQEVDIKPPHLVYLPRLEIYAENLSEYRERRKLFDDYGIEIPLKLVRCGDLMVIYSYAHEQKSLMNYVVEKSDDWKLSEILE